MAVLPDDATGDRKSSTSLKSTEVDSSHVASKPVVSSAATAKTASVSSTVSKVCFAVDSFTLPFNLLHMFCACHLHWLPVRQRFEIKVATVLWTRFHAGMWLITAASSLTLTQMTPFS